MNARIVFAVAACRPRRRARRAGAAAAEQPSLADEVAARLGVSAEQLREATYGRARRPHRRRDRRRQAHPRAWRRSSRSGSRTRRASALGAGRLFAKHRALVKRIASSRKRAARRGDRVPRPDARALRAELRRASRSRDRGGEGQDRVRARGRDARTGEGAAREAVAAEADAGAGRRAPRAARAAARAARPADAPREELTWER